MDYTDTDTSPPETGGIRDEQGQSLAEYALILSFVSIMAVGLTPVGQWVAVRLGDIAGAL
jgi:Flp pilus assembly pilin Flp